MRIRYRKWDFFIRKHITYWAVQLFEIILALIEITCGYLAFAVGHGRFHKRIFFECIGKGKADFAVLAVFVVYTVCL